MNAGTLWIEMNVNLARLSQDMNQAKSMIAGGMKDVERAVGTAKTAIAGLGLSLGAAGAGAALMNIVAMRAALDDLSDTTGDSITTLDGLRRQGIVSGVGLEQLGATMAKLARNMNDADEEGQKAGQALAAIGLKVELLRGSKPAEAILEIAKALDQFADGPGKVAVAVALLGKEGAKMLPFLKDLVNDGDAFGRVTAEQAAEAERLEKALRRLQLAYSDTKDELATGLIPKMASWVESNREAIKIAGSAAEAARLFVFNLDAMTSERPRQEIERLTTALKNFQEAGSIGRFMQSPTGAIFGGREEDLKKQLEFLRYLERQQALDGRTGPSFLDARDLRAAQKPILDPGKLGGKAKEVGDEDAAYRSLLKTLKEKALLDYEQTETAKLLLALEAMSAKNLATITPERKKELEDLAAKIDLQKRLKDQMENTAKNEDALQKMRQEGAEMEAEADRKRLEAYDANQKTIEQIQFETSLIGLSNEAREQAIALRALELSGIKQSDSAYEGEARRLREALAARQGVQRAAEAAEDFRRREAEDWSRMWSGVEGMGKTVFAHVFSDGKNAFEGIGKAIKASVIDLLYELTAKKWLIQIGASLGGSMGVAGAANAASGIGGLGSIGNLGSLGGLFSGGGTMIGGSAGLPGILGTGIAEEAAALGIAQVSGGAMAGISSALAAVPGWGWAALAAGAVLGGDSLFGSKGPKASDAALRRRANGDFGIEMNNVAGGNPDIGQVMALNAMLNDSSKFDPAKLAGLVDTQVSTGSPADTAALIGLLTKALQPAADSAVELTKAAEDLAKAEEEAKRAAEALAAERRGLEIRLMEATGDAAGALAAKRQLEMDATNDLNRELLRQIYAAEDAATAQAAATKAQEEAAKAADQLRQAEEQARAQLEAQRRDAVLSAVDTLRDAYDREASSLEAMASRWADASKSLRDYGDSLVGTSTGTMSYTAAARKFADVARRAQLGDLDAIAAFQSAGEQFRSASLAGSSTALEHALNVAKIQQAAYGTANLADRQESVALEQRDQLRAQKELLIGIDDKMTAFVDAANKLIEKVSEATGISEDSLREMRDLTSVIEAVSIGHASLLIREAA